MASTKEGNIIKVVFTNKDKAIKRVYHDNDEVDEVDVDVTVNLEFIKISFWSWSQTAKLINLV